MRNKYAKRSRISEKKFRQLVKLFSLDLDAVQISELSHLNRNTINRYLAAMRNRIAEFCELESPLKGEVEIDESYFGAKRIKGKRGRGASGKTIVFGIFNRHGKVYTEIVPDASRKTLQDIIRGRVDMETIIHSDGWRGYNGLVDLGYKNTLECTMERTNLLEEKHILMVLKAFGAMLKQGSPNSVGSRKSLSIIILKNVNLDSITGMKICIKLC